MILPVVIFYLLFMYKPMYGVIIAFMIMHQQKAFGVVSGLALNILNAFLQAHILVVC